MPGEPPPSLEARPTDVADENAKAPGLGQSRSEISGARPILDPAVRHLLKRTALTSLRSYALGCCLTALPSLVDLWKKALRSENLDGRSVWRKALASRPGIFLAMLTGVFTLLDGTFKLVLRRKNRNRSHAISVEDAEKGERKVGMPLGIDDVMPTFCAGATAGCLSVLVLHSRLDIALTATVRAVDFLVYVAYKRSRLSWAPSWIIDQGDSLFFAVSCSEIMFSWFFCPEALPRSYVKWISYMGDLNPDLVQAMRLVRKGEFYGPQGKKHSSFLAPYCADIRLPESMGDGTNGKVPCIVVHGGINGGCEIHAVARWLSGFRKAFKLYLPVHLLPVLLFRTRRLLNRRTAVTTLRNILTSSARSASFLATFVAMIWYSICLFRTRLGDPLKIPLEWRDGSALGPVFGSLVGGALSIQLENKRRRGEMMLYCCPRALGSLWWRLKHALHIKRGIPYADVALFSASMGVLTTAMQHDRNALRSSTSGFLQWLLMETAGSA